MQHGELVKLFPELVSLDIHISEAVFGDYQSRFEQVTALTRLTTLTVSGDFACALIRNKQVSRHRSHHCVGTCTPA